MQPSVLCERGLLCGLQFLVALFRQVEQRVQLGAVERAVFGSALNFNEFAGTGHGHVHIGHGLAVFDVRQVKHRCAIDHAYGHGGNAVFDHALGKNTTLLVDPYNIEEAVKTAVEVAGPELGGVRIDSGDLASLAQRVRNQLDALGATNTKITVTNDLDEYALASLQTAPVDSYGVGTMLVTGSGAPTCAMVYKLTERENSAGDMQPVAKKSKDKATVPGRKLAFRSYEYSLADCEHVISGSEEQLAAYQPEEGWKDLLVGYVSNGEINSDYQGHEAIVNAHNYRAQALAELPIGAQSLMKGDPVIPTEITVL